MRRESGLQEPVQVFQLFPVQTNLRLFGRLICVDQHWQENLTLHLALDVPPHGLDEHVLQIQRRVSRGLGEARCAKQPRKEGFAAEVELVDEVVNLELEPCPRVNRHRIKLGKGFAIDCAPFSERLNR